MIYFIVILLLLASELLYLRLASRRDSLIVPYWNEATSVERNFITVRGGGICCLHISSLLELYTLLNRWMM